MPRDEIEQRLAQMGACEDDEIDIAESALLLGALDAPEVPLAPYRDHVDELVEDVARAMTEDAPIERRCRQINAVLFDHHGYAGDTESYDSLENANLIRVIDRRVGLPVSLGILYIHLARAQGWPVTGLAFPGHFLVRMDDRDKRLILDPFHAGQALEAGHLRGLLKQFLGNDAELEPAHYAPVSTRAVLLRLQNNIKTRAIQTNDFARACEVLERMTLIAPGAGSVWQELGLIRAQLGEIRSGVSALERCLDCSLPEAMRTSTERALAKLRTSLN